MKQLIFIIVLFSSLQTQAQQWLDVGVKAGFGVDVLYNKSIFDTNEMNVLMGLTPSYGVKAGFNFDYTNEFTFDANWTKFEQTFAYDLRFNTDPQKLTLQNLDLLAMYRRNHEGGYVEVGPQLTFVQSVDFANVPSTKSEAGSSPSYVRQRYFSAVIGFGGYYPIANNMTFAIGPRLKVGLQDLLTVEGKGTEFVSGPVKLQENYKTIPFVAELVAEFNFDLGYFAKAKCKRKGRRFKLF